MKKKYDFKNSKKNPYVKGVKKTKEKQVKKNEKV